MSDPRRAAATVACLLATCALAACGSSGSSSRTATSASAADPATTSTAAAGNLVAGSPSAPAGTHAPAKEVADPEEASSFPAPATFKHARRRDPREGRRIRAPRRVPRPKPKSSASCSEMQAVERSPTKAQEARLTPVPGGQSIGGNGTMPIPASVPEVIQKVIAGANEIADFPYVYGGGHASFVDNAYDCSGSVSYALAAGGLLSSPETSGELESWGVPGPGRYITVYANAGHTYMYVDGVLYDTAGRSGVYASRWLVGSTDNAGYVVRHYPGL